MFKLEHVRHRKENLQKKKIFKELNKICKLFNAYTVAPTDSLFSNLVSMILNLI